MDSAGVSWVPVEPGGPIPSTAVLVGGAGSSRANYVGRRNGEAGHITVGLCVGGFAGSAADRAEILCCQGAAHWVQTRRGDPMPDGAVLAGSTATDGETYAARRGGVGGKANTEDGQGGRFWNFWCAEQASQDAEVLVVEAPQSMSWVPVEPGGPIPSTAVLVGGAGSSRANYVGRRNGEAGHITAGLCVGSFAGSAADRAEILCCQGAAHWVQTRRGDPMPDGAVLAGSTATDGETYVARRGGVGGKANTEDGQGGRFWNFWCAEQASQDAEVLVVEAPQSMSWVPVEPGGPIPSTAVLVGGAGSSRANYVGRRNGEAGHITVGLCVGGFAGSAADRAEILCCQGAAHWVQTRRGDPMPDGAVLAGSTATDGETYAARRGGVGGKANTEDGQGGRFWNFWCAEQASQDAEVLVVGQAAGCGGENSIKILQFNIWQEGSSVEGGLEKIADVIVASDVDVVALSEVRNYHGDLHERLKAALLARGHRFNGFFVQDGANDVGLLSRFPIEKAEPVTEMPSDFSSKMVAYHLVCPRGKLCVVSCHLEYTSYAVNLPRGYGDGGKMGFGKLPDGPCIDPLELQRVDESSNRVEAIDAFLRYAASLPIQTPCVLAGDFNECSHLDWTEATRGLYGHNGATYSWRNSRVLLENGFQDSWRELYPDPVTHLGATWPSEAHKVNAPSPSWCPDADERDRIDFVYHNSCLRAASAHIVGSPIYIVHGQPVEDASCCALAAVQGMPWPSDHKAVRVELEFVS